jgi:hypothetical protein
MIGLLFLSVGIGWVWLALWVALWVARKAPAWVGVKHPVGKSLLGAVVLAVLLVGPFVDHIIGVQQFEKLCDERTVMQVSPIANLVVRATRLELPGYWIKIRSSPVAYADADTGRQFLRYDILNTKGGRVAGFAMLGGSHQCTPKDYSPAERLNIDKLVEQGKQK